MNRFFVLIGALLSLVSAAPASADPLTLESYAFFLFDVPGTYADGSTTAGLSFYDDSAFGGISIVTWNQQTLDLSGISLFTGPSSAPTLFAFGPTQFTEYQGTATYTITAEAGVPEPASWAMLLIGTGLAGAGIRRRRDKLAFA